MAEFVRLAEVVNKKDMRVVSVTVVPTISDCSGRIWLTDLRFQEGAALSGYAPHTETMLQKYTEDGTVKTPVWFNGVVRSAETVILANLGGTSAGLGIHIYPKSGMAAGSVQLAQGVGGRKVSSPAALSAGDNLALLASARECTINGNAAVKEGFYQYSAAWDSKHLVPFLIGHGWMGFTTMRSKSWTPVKCFPECLPTAGTGRFTTRRGTSAKFIGDPQHLLCRAELAEGRI